MFLRFDRAGGFQAVRQANGKTVYSGVVARAGNHEYLWGTEYRSDAELARVVDQLRDKPITIQHPDLLFADGGKAPVVGRILSARVDGPLARVDLELDTQGVSAVKSGIGEFSLGYKVQSERGQPHFGTVVDHVALVRAGRCGSECSIRTDCSNCDEKNACKTCAIMGQVSKLTFEEEDTYNMADKNRNDAALADALAKVSQLEAQIVSLKSDREVEKARADKAQGEVDSYRARVDSLEKAAEGDDRDHLQLTIKGLTSQLESEKKARRDAEDPEKLAAAVRARVDLETKAIAAFGDKDRSRVDGMDDRTLMVSVIEKLHNVAIETDKSLDYVRARFDSAVDGFFKGQQALASLRQAAAPEKPDARKDARSARERMIDANRNAWKAPLPNQKQA